MTDDLTAAVARLREHWQRAGCNCSLCTDLRTVLAALEAEQADARMWSRYATALAAIPAVRMALGVPHTLKCMCPLCSIDMANDAAMKGEGDA